MDKSIKKLNTLFNKTLSNFNKFSDGNAKEFIDDVNMLYKVINVEKYSFGFISFWEYFTSKYTIDNKYITLFDNDKDFARSIYYKCVIPLNVKLDIILIGDKPTLENLKSSIFSILESAKGSIRDLVISSIAIVIIISSVTMSNYSYNLEDFWNSNLYMGIATGVFAGLVIKWINSYIRRKREVLEHQRNLATKYTEYYFENIEEELAKYKEALKKSNKEEILLNFVNINNLLNDYMKRIVKFKAIKILDEYFLLVKFEKEIFDYSKELVKRLFPNNISSLSDKEISKLNIYLVELNDLLDTYLLGYRFLIQKINKDIIKINTKIIK